MKQLTICNRKRSTASPPAILFLTKIMIIVIIIIICANYFVKSTPINEEKIDLELRLNSQIGQPKHSATNQQQNNENFIDLTLSDDDEQAQQNDHQNDQRLNNQIYGGGGSTASNHCNDWDLALKEKALTDRRVNEIIRLSLTYLGIEWDMEAESLNVLTVDKHLYDKIGSSSIDQSTKDLLSWVKKHLKDGTKIWDEFEEISNKICAEVTKFGQKYDTEMGQSISELIQIDPSFAPNADQIKRNLQQFYTFYCLYQNLQILRKKQICPLIYTFSASILSLCKRIEFEMIEIAIEFGVSGDDFLKIMMIRS